MISQYLLENGRIVIKRMRHGLMLFNRNDIIRSEERRVGKECRL